jgi:plasmid maintenance system antidote protein VapI
VTRKIHPLRSYRQEKNLRTSHVAEKLGIAESTVRSFENGTRTIDADWALKIEKLLGISRNALRPDLFGRRAA